MAAQSVVATPVAAPVAAPVAPAAEFRPADQAQPWRVDRARELQAEFSLRGNPDQVLPVFWEIAQRHPRLALLVRRLYGIGPVVPPVDAAVDDFEPWSASRLAEAGFEVGTDLNSLRAIWQGAQANAERGATECGVRSAECGVGEGGVGESNAREELALDDQVLARYGFSERMFKITIYDPEANGGKGGEVLRPERENQEERNWFIRRVEESQAMLANPRAGRIARDNLLNDLYLRRLEAEIAVAGPKARETLYDRKKTLSREYAEGVERLETMFPNLATANQETFRHTVSDMVVAMRDYYAHADRQRIDGVFTANEIEFMTRESLQVGARYRFDLTVAIMAAVHGLFDPDVAPLFKPAVLRKVQAAAKAALDLARQEAGQPLVDLENGVRPGEGDDFEDFREQGAEGNGQRAEGGEQGSDR